MSIYVQNALLDPYGRTQRSTNAFAECHERFSSSNSDTCTSCKYLFGIWNMSSVDKSFEAGTVAEVADGFAQLHDIYRRTMEYQIHKHPFHLAAILGSVINFNNSRQLNNGNLDISKISRIIMFMPEA